MPSEPFVSIIVPALNEEGYIRDAINSLISAEDIINYELIVLDGGSTDLTKSIVAEMAVANPRIRLEANPARYQSAAVNRGAKIARPESSILVRADCHAAYPPNFVAGLVRQLRERDVASIVVPMRTRGKGFLQRGIAAAQNSRLGNGGAAHRIADNSRYVDHGHHAAFVRSTFLALEGYDETFTHNEDAEFDIRLRRTGAQIWLCSELAITYFPRNTFRALARQYFNHGSGRARTLFKHRRRPKIRQLLPVGALGMNALSIALCLGLGWPFLLPSVAYTSACLAGGMYLAISDRDPAGCAAGPAAIVMHHAWATGLIFRAVRILVTRAPQLPMSKEALR